MDDTDTTVEDQERPVKNLFSHTEVNEASKQDECIIQIFKILFNQQLQF